MDATLFFFKYYFQKFKNIMKKLKFIKINELI